MKPTPQSAHRTYVEREVATAAPQKLQLMLIEAAIKNIHRVKLHWENNKTDEAFQSLTRAQDIVTEILCSLDMENSPEIAKSLASIYVFIFRKIALTHGLEDSANLDDALKVLMAERESWKEICEKFGARTDAAKQNSASFDSKIQNAGAKLQEIKSSAPHKPRPATVSSAGQGTSWDA
ncbi:MAG: flagellar export chaperone FliS [Planctomycetaceae bacterium]|jgi:flagellar protein FliS|nr:flagellar export chaperone FliS [Planctomycetaceae bacterium]